MYLSQHDWYTCSVSLLIIALAIAGIEIAARKALFNKMICRKILHLVAIATCAYAIDNFENKRMLSYIFMAAFFVLLWVVKKGWMQVNEDKTYGIALFPLAFGILLLIPAFSNKNVVFAVLTLCIADSAAGIAGEYAGRNKIVFLFETKSWTGFAAFFFSAFVLALFYFRLFSLQGFLCCVILAILPALTELFSYRGSDNLTVPLVTALWAFLILPLTTIQLQLISVLLLILLILSYFAVHKRWLSISGAAAACWTGLLLYITGGYAAFFAPGIFLICGSLLSKLNKPVAEKKGRNGIQVFANGITGIICMIIFKITINPIYLQAALLSFCISMSDSVSSETGTYLKGATFDILSFKRIKAGISGGISLYGTVFGLAGAVLSATTGLLAFHLKSGVFLWIILGGFAGMLLDSILGSLLQGKFIDPAGEISEEYSKENTRVKGYAWCNNDMVNILSNLVITSAFIILNH